MKHDDTTLRTEVRRYEGIIKKSIVAYNALINTWKAKESPILKAA